MTRIIRSAAIVAISLLGLFSSEIALSDESLEKLKGKGVSLVVEEPGKLKSNTSVAMLFGAVGQSVRGSTLQNELKPLDPSMEVGSMLMEHLRQTHAISTGKDYTLTVRTTDWGIHDAIGDNQPILYIGGIIKMNLQTPDGNEVASGTCNTAFPLKDDIYVNPKNISAGDASKVNAGLKLFAKQCYEKFVKKF